jgi:hypothetical protein
MTVDPILKQDLMLIRKAFEEGALGQSGEAIWIPTRSMLSTQRQAHQSIRDSAKRYPSYYARHTDAKQSLLDRIQEECIPCIDRIKILKECDIGLDIDDSLIQYNQNILKELTGFFETFEGKSPVEENVCEIYKGFRSQCIPDLRRVIIALTFLLSDIRNVSLRSVAENFMQVVLAMIGNLVVNITFSLDQFAQLITNTIKCVLQDVREQLAKVEPILSREDSPEGLIQGVERTERILRDSWKDDDAANHWAQRTASTQPNYNEVPFSGQMDSVVNRAQEITDRLPTLHATVDAGGLIQNMLQKAIQRVDGNLEIAKGEFLKLLKSSHGNFQALNELVAQIQTVIGLLSVIEGIVESRGDYDPCTRESDERFFIQLTLPRRRVTVKRVDTDLPDDIEVDIIPDTTSVDNPVIEEILEEAGVDLVKVDDSSVEVRAEPVTISVTKCLGG